MPNNQKEPRPRSDFEAPIITDFSEGEVFKLGDKTATVTDVTVEKQGAMRAFLEYECDEPDCLVCGSGNDHRMYEQQMRRWYKSNYLRR